MTTRQNEIQTKNSQYVKAGFMMVTAAAGSKLADKVVGGGGLATLLAQAGGALLGLLVGSKISDEFIKSDQKDT